MTLGYIGPDVTSLLWSAVVAVVGAVLIGWRWIVKQCKTAFRFVTGSSRKDATGSEQG